MSGYAREYASYLTASHFRDMLVRYHALKIRDVWNAMRDTDVGASVKRWLQCGGSGMFVFCCVGSDVYSNFVCCYDDVECDKDMWTAVSRFDSHLLPKNWSFPCRLVASIQSFVFSRTLLLLGSRRRIRASFASSRAGNFRRLASRRFVCHTSLASA